MSLTEIIIQRIQKEGPISFFEFMEMALYYPGSGYYTSPEEKIGKRGDFYTSPFITSVFGEMIAKQLEEMWELLGKQSFSIVEYGAGTGILCRDILGALKKNPEFYDKLDYCIIEKSPAMREKEREILGEKVSWYDSIGDLPVFTGCILSNEVLDNFSVHQVVMEEELMEIFVGYDDSGFLELLRPASRELKEYLEELKVVLPKGYRTEINLQATHWIKEIADRLKQGFVLTIDYGYPSSELYSPKRSQGTIVCYHKHGINYSPYINIGKQDITTHINFSALRHWGLKNGIEYAGFTTQSYFLMGLGLTEHLRKKEEGGNSMQYDIKEKAFLIHTFLLDMGTKFKILLQQKGLEPPVLSGFRFPGHSL
jgi:SAM-dependent MidA family methyltransferase